MASLKKIKQYISDRYDIGPALKDNIISITKQIANDEDLKPLERLKAVQMILEMDSLNLKEESIHTPKQINIDVTKDSDQELGKQIADVELRLREIEARERESTAPIIDAEAREVTPLNSSTEELQTKQLTGTQPT